MSVFKFKNFSVEQIHNSMKVGTDSMIFGVNLKYLNCKNALDIGSGTGVLSLMLAQLNHNIKIFGIEIDENSAFECEKNFNNSPYNQRLFCIYHDFLKYEFKNKFDLIFSNPPYFSNSLLSNDINKNRVRHNYILPIEKMLKKILDILERNGVFQCIIPSDTIQIWIDVSKKNGLFINEKINIYSKENNLKRNILTFSRNKLVEIFESNIVIRDEQNAYTSQYKNLTKEFHYYEL